MITLSNDQDGRLEAAVAIKKALAGAPAQRDTINTIFKNYGVGAGRSGDATVALVRKVHDGGTKSNIVPLSAETLRKRGADAMAKSIAGALRKVGLPTQSSNASNTIAMPDTGGSSRPSQQMAPTDKPTLFGDRSSSAVTGAKTPPEDDDVLAAIRKDLSNPKRFGR